MLVPYAAIDEETTGLVAHEGKLLSVACVMVDRATLAEIGEPFVAIVRYSPEKVEAMKAEVVPLVLNMHTETGLWDQLSGPDALPLEEVDELLLAHIKRYAPEPKTALFAGSSIRLDMNFGEVHLPKTMKHLHYRNVDVSAIREEKVSQGQYTMVSRPKPHEALTDIRASIELLQELRDAEEAYWRERLTAEIEERVRAELAPAAS